MHKPSSQPAYMARGRVAVRLNWKIQIRNRRIAGEKNSYATWKAIAAPLPQPSISAILSGRKRSALAEGVGSEDATAVTASGDITRRNQHLWYLQEFLLTMPLSTPSCVGNTPPR